MRKAFFESDVGATKSRRWSRRQTASRDGRYVDVKDCAFGRLSIPIGIGVLSWAVFLAACTEQGSDSGDSPPAVFEDAFEVEDTLILKEAGDTLVASPNLRWDREGGWLYWDGMIPQVRKYDMRGSLVLVMGGRGDGPGEFSRVAGFMRTATGQLVSVDQSGRIATWSDAGELIGEFSTGLAPIAGAISVGEHVLLIARFGVAPGPEAPDWLHLVDLDLREVVASLPGPEIAAEHIAAAMAVDGPQPREFDATIYAGVSALDTIWSWGDAGTGRASEPIAVPSPSMSRNEVPPPPGADFRRFREWFDTSWFLGDFVRLPDGRWLYQIWSFRDESFLGRFLLTDPEGQALWEVGGDFRILDVDPEGRIYLWDPAGSNPAEIRVARVR